MEIFLLAQVITSEDCFKVWDVRVNKPCFRVFDKFNSNNVGYSAIKFMPDNICTITSVK